tara:strand:- start:45 stop:674 length:630 start_codon:yes stop_codon:yes gene_type:complete
MAYVLSATVLVAGLEQEAIALLGTYKHLSTLATPVTEASMRADLETSQVQPFTNTGWTNFVTQMSNLPLDDSLLTAAEASIVNTFRAVISPDPALDCCGVVVPVVTGTMVTVKRTGTATFEHSFTLNVADNIDCAIKSARIQFIGAPAFTTPNPFVCNFVKCENGFRLFRNYWIDFASDPVGVTYGVNVTFLDSDGVALYTPLTTVHTM